MKYFVTLNGRTWEIELAAGRASVDGAPHQATLRAVDGSPLHVLELDGRCWRLALSREGHGRWQVLTQGERSEVEVLDERAAHIRSLIGEPAASTGPLVLKAPMPGLVVRVRATPGQKVVEGTSLIVLEAMKMENELKAPGSGVVAEVAVRTGQTVERGQLLVRLALPT